MIHTGSLSTQEAEGGESGVEGPLWLHGQVKASLGYMSHGDSSVGQVPVAQE